MTNKLIVFQANNEYYGVWVDAGDMDRQRAIFANKTHLICDSQIEAAMFLKIAVRNIHIRNKIPHD